MTTSLILTEEDNLIYIIVSYRLLCELPVVSDDCLLYDVSRGFYSHSKPQLLDWYHQNSHATIKHHRAPSNWISLELSTLNCGAICTYC